MYEADMGVILPYSRMPDQQAGTQFVPSACWSLLLLLLLCVYVCLLFGSQGTALYCHPKKAIYFH